MTAAALFRPPLPRRWFRLRWPREVSDEQALSALLALSGLATPRRRDALILQAVGSRDGVAHQVGAVGLRASGVRRQLQAAIPGIDVAPLDEAPELEVDRAWRLWVSSTKRPLRMTDPQPVATALLTALASVRSNEQVVVQWLLGPVRRPLAVGSSVTGDHGRLPGALLKAPFVAPANLDSEARRALTTKQGLPGWRADLRLGVRTTGLQRQRQLLGRVAAAVRMARSPGVEVGFHGCQATVLSGYRLPLRWPVAINVGELRSAWPLGPTDQLPVARVGSRPLPPVQTVPRTGRVIGEGTYPGRERPLAISPRDALQHLHVIGPTGVGKSTLLLNLICQDMAAGRGVVVIEPKGDLVADVLSRVPEQRQDDVVVLDPTDVAPVGLNPLARGQAAPELVVDQVLAVFKGVFADPWGPRTQDILTAGLLTLTATPGLSLVALPLLFTDGHVRRRLVSRIRDPLALGPFWQWFENLSAAERAAVLAPLMNKLRAFLLRERVRAVIGQGQPKFDLRQVFTERRILLVNLAKGALGPEASALLGSLMVSQLWQTALGRGPIVPAQRHPVFVYVDEFQDYLHLPTDLGDVLAQARGLGVGLTLAHQHLAQLPPSVRAAVLANARSRVLFQAGHDDASLLVRSDARLTAADVVGLGKYEVYAALVAESQVTPFASARTLAPPMVSSDRQALRQQSRERWGTPRTEVEASLERLITGAATDRTSPPPNQRGSSGFGVIERDVHDEQGDEDGGSR